MKLIPVLLLLFFSAKINAQISILQSDLPAINDSLRYSYAEYPNVYNLNQTDTNYLWDLSVLNPGSQELEHYQSPSVAPIAYQLSFNSFNTDLTKKVNNMTIAGFPVSDVYLYYNIDNGEFKQTGFGISIQGLPMTVNYDSDEVLINYPLSYGDIDSSYAKWDLNIPTIGYIGQEKYRKNTVDGWGTIITPVGQFNCIRVKSEVIQIDTVDLNSSSIPLPAITSNYTQYFWLSNQRKLPIAIAHYDNDFNYTDYIKYYDIPRQFVSINESEISEAFDIYPNPASEYILFKNKLTEDFIISVYSIDGKILFSEKNPESVNIKSLKKGIYIVEIKTKSISIIKKLIKN